jgi:CheY-like chemotaxis protein
VLNGMDLCGLIRGTRKSDLPFARDVPVFRHLPILFVTAYDAKHREGLTASGASGVLSKPVEFRALNIALTRAILQTIHAP